MNIVALMALACPLRLALSSFHPPVISIATDSQVAALQAWRGLSGRSVDPYQRLFSDSRARVINNQPATTISQAGI